MAKITPIKIKRFIQNSNGIVFGYGSGSYSPKITLETRDYEVVNFMVKHKFFTFSYLVLFQLPLGYELLPIHLSQDPEREDRNLEVDS